uniref:Brown n=1 Tax=Nilaparvata lugens TaxID=108931 RepID=A0A2S0X9Z5_NILLU|nr:brown [Nilaparvata lugens]
MDYSRDAPAMDGRLTLSWHGLSVWVKIKDEEKSSWFNKHMYDTQLLHEVSGVAEPGSLTAIMGPSGAGKTTLLATISQRFKGKVEGDVLVNGRNMSNDVMTKLSGFVPQQDLTLGCLTVLEHMQLMARLKMDKDLPTSHRNQRVLSLLVELGLNKCKNTQISALSGGEMKKVALGVELLTNPPLLFCDEPTTGLDSYNASTVVEKLRQLAVQGRTVICSIHQPASGLFELFHNVVLLVGGGRLAYQGESKAALDYFNSLGLVCPTSYNLSEFLVSQLAVNVKDPRSRDRVARIADRFQASEQGQTLGRKLQQQLTRNQHMPNTFIDNQLFKGKEENEFESYLSIQQPHYLTQLYWLLWRSVMEIRRNPQDQLLRLAFYMVSSVAVLVYHATKQIALSLSSFAMLSVCQKYFIFTFDSDCTNNSYSDCN